MEPLHGYDNQAVLVVIESTEGGITEPNVGSLQRDLRVRIVGLNRIIDDQHVATGTGQSAPDRGREPIPTPRRLEFAFGGFSWIQLGARNHRLIERRLHQSTGVARKFVSEVLRIAGTNNSRDGIATQ